MTRPKKSPAVSKPLPPAAKATALNAAVAPPAQPAAGIPAGSPPADRCVGIDVGKESLQLTFLDGNAREDAIHPNTPEGIAAIVAFCRRSRVQLVVQEATGRLDLDLLVALQKAGIPVARINPLQSKAMAGVLMAHAKTDALDSHLLAQFARKIGPEPLAELSERQCLLDELSTRRRQLVDMLVAEKNRLLQTRKPGIRRDIEKHIGQLEKALGGIDGELRELTESDAAMKRIVEILDSIPGLGETSARALLVALPELGRLNRGQIASLAGLAPYNCDSGAAKGPRKIRGGRADARSAIFMPAMVAICHNPVLKAFRDGLVARGKLKMVALVAAMRKLLVIANSMVRENKLWGEFMPKFA